MAKRYYAYEILAAKAAGYFKPEGTLGRHHMTLTPQGETLVVVGSVEGRVTLKPGDTLGYALGSVWVVPRTDSYRDPIRRVLAEARVPQRTLEYSADPVEYEIVFEDGPDWPANSSADPAIGEEAVIFGPHKGEDVSFSSSTWRMVNRQRIVGGDAVVVFKVVGRENTTYRPRRAERIVVRPTADKKAVCEFLFETLTPEGRERKRLRESTPEWKEAQERASKEKWAEDVLRSSGIIPSPELVRDFLEVEKKKWRMEYLPPFIFEGDEYVLRHVCLGVPITFEFVCHRTDKLVRLPEAVVSGLFRAFAEKARKEE